MLLACLISCKKNEINGEDVADYFIPLQNGKYITYRLDSTVFLENGRSEVTNSYQEKHLVREDFKDNQGRTSYWIDRFIRDVNGTQAWKLASVYYVTPTNNSIEVTENRLRTIALLGPIKKDLSWKGNFNMSKKPYSDMYNFSNDNEMDNWDFIVKENHSSETINGKIYNQVLLISHVNELVNIPITNPSAFASKTVSFEKYAKGIGLVYQERALWEYQPNPGVNNTPYKVGFEVKRSIIDHN
jgi:hypothetical protein